jgi:hypothetical protein
MGQLLLAYWSSPYCWTQDEQITKKFHYYRCKSYEAFISKTKRSQEILKEWTPRQLRLSFLSQLWNSRMDFNESLQAEVKAREVGFNVSVQVV